MLPAFVVLGIGYLGVYSTTLIPLDTLSSDTLPRPDIPCPQIPYPPPRDLAPEVPYPQPQPHEQIDRRLWKHYLPATTIAGGKNELVIVSKWISLIFFFQDTRSSEDRVKEIIESLCHISESKTWKGFFSTLSECGNQQVADKVRGDIAATAMAEQIEEGSTCCSSLFQKQPEPEDKI